MRFKAGGLSPSFGWALIRKQVLIWVFYGSCTISLHRTMHLSNTFENVFSQVDVLEAICLRSLIRETTIEV